MKKSIIKSRVIGKQLGIWTVLFLGFWYVNAQEPNVIIIITDDQGYGDLSCHGNPVLKTPNLDKLYKESIRFTDFHVSPFCTPTRAAVMTGHYPGSTGAWRTSSGRSMMHTDEKTLGHLFNDAGYTTGMVGKWHLGDNAPHRPQDRGFQDVVWHRGGGVGQAPDYWGNDYFDDTYERNGKFEQFEGYCTDVWFREATRFVEENKEKPFFLYLATNAPHSPYIVADEWSDPYVDKEDVNANFYGMIANIDHNIGLLRNKLDELGLDDNTILVFMSDNGTSAGHTLYNAGMNGKKGSLYDGGHRVPFFIYWPRGGLKGGRDVSTLAAHIDILPTLADLCGVEIPAEYKPHGLSLKPLLHGKENQWTREYLVDQFLGGIGARYMPPKAQDHAVIMTQQWRLVNYGDDELYDMRTDFGQKNNVAKQYPDIVEHLYSLYEPYWETISPRLEAVAQDVGSKAQNPVVLVSQDWRLLRGNPPWNFEQIKRIPKVTGPWHLNVKKAGRYRLTLRQFPKEADKEVIGVKAEIEIGDQRMVKPVNKGSKGVVFEVDLAVGPIELRTWIYDENGDAGGAYFTEVEAL